jgi:gliding motility-associated-like protein
VAVFDNKGCPKPGLDSVVVRVIPPVPAFAGNDTSIVLGQPLQLNATGGDVYRWTPSTGLSDPNIANPVATLSNDITYVVRVSTPEGCSANDTINIKVFFTNPDIFVPTAFTPNNDRKNDQLIPIPVGVTRLDYFRVYNRYGELIFSTTQIGKGWDGKINGKEQNTSTFAWYVQGVDYTGKTIFKKGTSTLIR